MSVCSKLHETHTLMRPTKLHTGLFFSIKTRCPTTAFDFRICSIIFNAIFFNLSNHRRSVPTVSNDHFETNNDVVFRIVKRQISEGEKKQRKCRELIWLPLGLLHRIM